MERATYRPAAGMCRFGYSRRVLLMDEPFAAVDAQTRADLIRGLWHRFQVTTPFVTHNIDEAVCLAQRVLILSSSRRSSATTSPSICPTSATSSPPARPGGSPNCGPGSTSDAPREDAGGRAGHQLSGPPTRTAPSTPPLDHDSARSDLPVR
jgi:energy-coupling factor transporter ATP-binding protein EcfA2